MKFRLFRPDLPSKATRKSIRQIKKPQIDTRAVETWNELRLIGTEGAYRKQFGAKDGEDDEENDLMKEAQDWDNLIAQFNEQYTQQLKQSRKHGGDESSISTIADTKSELLKSRRRRNTIYRKCFIVTCILLWVTALLGINDWHLVYHIYPIGFLKELDIGIIATYFDPKAGWGVLVANIAVWATSSIGVMLSLCFQHKPQYLRQYILRAPIILIVPIMTILINVRFTGLISTQKLEYVLDEGISKYHVNKDNRDKNDNAKLNAYEWDKIQSMMHCCGIHSSADWESVDNNQKPDDTYIPTSCCPKPYFRERWSKQPPQKDDCFYKVNKKEGQKKGYYEWAYAEGCLNKAYDFYVKACAHMVLLSFFQLLIQVANFAMGKQLYTILRKCTDLRFKYTWKRYVFDVLFITACTEAGEWCCATACCRSIFRCKCARRCARKKTRMKTLSSKGDSLEEHEGRKASEQGSEGLKSDSRSVDEEGESSKPKKRRYPSVILTGPSGSDIHVPGEDVQVLLHGDGSSAIPSSSSTMLIDPEKGGLESDNSSHLAAPPKRLEENPIFDSSMSTIGTNESRPQISSVASSVVNEKSSQNVSVKDSLMNMFDDKSSLRSEDSSSKGKKKITTGKRGKKDYLKPKSNKSRYK